MEKLKIAVLGDGGWGTTLALLLHSKGYDISIWSVFPDYAKVLQTDRENHRFLPGIKIPDDVRITSIGSVVLSSDLPIERNEIEQLMKKYDNAAVLKVWLELKQLLVYFPVLL